MELCLGGGYDEILSNHSKDFDSLGEFIKLEYSVENVFPPYENLFSAFRLTPFRSARVVILGQDPYHEKGQATGLAFSVPRNIKFPPSLRNILKEVEAEYKQNINFKNSSQNDILSGWASQGVLLLNTVLSVREGKAFSHAGKGWENLTDEIIAALSRRNTPTVFMLWGKAAENKRELISEKENLILSCAHPSPLSAYRGFFGCNHFLAANEFLVKRGIPTIDFLKV